MEDKTSGWRQRTWTKITGNMDEAIDLAARSQGENGSALHRAFSAMPFTYLERMTELYCTSRHPTDHPPLNDP